MKESEFKKLERSRKGKQLKIGDSAELHDLTDWPWEESEQDWDGLEDRAARNSEKGKRKKETMYLGHWTHQGGELQLF